MIDNQHQELFNIINQFNDELSNKQSKKLAVCTLNILIQFAQKHFSDEKKISKEFNFPEEDLTRASKDS